MFILPQGRWRARSGNRSFSLPVIFYDVAESGRKAFRPCRIGLLRERVGLHSAPQARIDRPVDKLGASHPLPQAAFKLASLLRQARLAQAVDNGLKLGEIRRIVAHRCPGGVGAGDGKGRVECKAGLDGGPTVWRLSLPFCSRRCLAIARPVGETAVRSSVAGVLRDEWLMRKNRRNNRCATIGARELDQNSFRRD